MCKTLQKVLTAENRDKHRGGGETRRSLPSLPLSRHWGLCLPWVLRISSVNLPTDVRFCVTQGRVILSALLVTGLPARPREAYPCRSDFSCMILVAA